MTNRFVNSYFTTQRPGICCRYSPHVAEHSYRYLAESTVVESKGETSVALATAGGKAPNPYFFSGFVEDPALASQALLAVAEVARTRYFEPGASARSRDPVVTANDTVLRFESFSGCNGVYARLDVDATGLDGEFHDWGTTNVDMNQPMRTALARLQPGEPMRLSVGQDSLTVDTLDDSVVEKKVPLPDRWVRGFAEVSVIASGMVLRHELPAGPARRVLRDIPRNRIRGTAWVKWAATGARVTANPGPDDTCLAGPYRLASLGRLIPHVQGLRVYAPPPEMRVGVGARSASMRAAQPTAWEVVFGSARLVLTLSPEIYRGFSGEGGVLEALSAVDGRLLSRVDNHLHGQSEIHSERLADVLGVDRAGAEDLVRGLGAAGRVGFDLDRGLYFHRDLPFDRSALETMQPRLVAARELVAAGAVSIDGDRATVHSGKASYLVRFTNQGTRCTCPWFAKHRGERGPCKHVLAAQLARTHQTT